MKTKVKNKMFVVSWYGKILNDGFLNPKYNTQRDNAKSKDYYLGMENGTKDGALILVTFI